MKVTFWGVRGSIASPGPSTVRYGGNTTCIEIRTDDNDLLILDAGTGLFPLSRTLAATHPVTSNILITHSHWDHIQGLPFFVPNFIEGNSLRLYGPPDPSSPKGIEHILDVQLQHNYFPVLESEMKSRIDYVTLQPEQSVFVGSAKVTPHLMSHFVVTYGYRIEADGQSVFFTGDHEPPNVLFSPDHPNFDQHTEDGQRLRRNLMGAMSGIDVLIADCSFTSEEYPAKRGWGHGTFQSSIDYAKQAGAKVLFCTHHEPTRTDDELEAVFAQVLRDNPNQAGDPQYILAKEGYTFEW